MRDLSHHSLGSPCSDPSCARLCRYIRATNLQLEARTYQSVIRLCRHTLVSLLYGYRQSQHTWCRPSAHTETRALVRALTLSGARRTYMKISLNHDHACAGHLRRGFAAASLPEQSTQADPQLPAFDYQPLPYNGPSKEEVRALRKQFLSPGGS